MLLILLLLQTPFCCYSNKTFSEEAKFCLLRKKNQEAHLNRIALTFSSQLLKILMILKSPWSNSRNPEAKYQSINKWILPRKHSEKSLDILKCIFLFFFSQEKTKQNYDFKRLENLSKHFVVLEMQFPWQPTWSSLYSIINRW
jgi:hypothetical protein